MLAFVGSRTTRERNARGSGLTVYEIDAAGRWNHLQTVDLANPSYQVLDPVRRTLYTVHGDQREISAFAIDAQGRLSLINQCSTGGRNPVHLAWSLDRTHLLIANYATGTLASIEVTPEGALGRTTALLEFFGVPGPRAQDQKGSHPHQVLRWPNADLFIVPDKGLDRVHLVRLDSDGALRQVNALQAAPGAGCRHAVLDARQSLLWVCNELDSTLTTCRVDPVTDRLEALSTVNLLTAEAAKTNTAAGIARVGDMIYVSNRGWDAVVVLRTEAASGAAQPVQTQSTMGATPRYITPTPDNGNLLVANESSDSIVQMPIQADGLLGSPRCVVATGSPVCVSFL